MRRLAIAVAALLMAAEAPAPVAAQILPVTRVYGEAGEMPQEAKPVSPRQQAWRDARSILNKVVGAGFHDGPTGESGPTYFTKIAASRAPGVCQANVITLIPETFGGQPVRVKAEMAYAAVFDPGPPIYTGSTSEEYRAATARVNDGLARTQAACAKLKSASYFASADSPQLMAAAARFLVNLRARPEGVLYDCDSAMRWRYKGCPKLDIDALHGLSFEDLADVRDVPCERADPIDARCMKLVLGHAYALGWHAELVVAEWSQGRRVVFTRIGETMA